MGVLGIYELGVKESQESPCNFTVIIDIVLYLIVTTKGHLLSFANTHNVLYKKKEGRG